MNFLSRIFKKNNQQNLTQTTNGQSYAEWVNLFPNSNESEFMSYRSFAYACINIRAESIMSGKVYLYKQQLNKQKEIFEHPFLELINRTNIYQQSFSDILFLISASLDLNGNAYCLAYSNENNPFKIPEGLIVFPINSITPVLNSSGTAIEYYRYSGSGQQINYSPEEIIHFKLPNPENIFIGKSTVSALKIPLKTDYYQSLYQSSFYKNNARIDGVLETENKLTPDIFDRLKTQFNSQYRGSENSGKTMILENGLKYNQTSATPKEADYKDSRITNRDEIMSIFRVPKSIMGITDDVNRANATATLRGYMLLTIIPYSKFIQSKLENFVKKVYDSRLILKLDFSLQEDRELQLRFYDVALRYGLVTRNELREQENYENSTDPKANELIISGNNSPIDNQKKEVQPTQTN